MPIGRGKDGRSPGSAPPISGTKIAYSMSDMCRYCVTIRPFRNRFIDEVLFCLRDTNKCLIPHTVTRFSETVSKCSSLLNARIQF